MTSASLSAFGTKPFGPFRPTNACGGEHRGVRRQFLDFQLPQIPAAHFRAAGIGRTGQPIQPAPQFRVLAGFLKQPPLVFPEGDARRIPFFRRERRRASPTYPGRDVRQSGGALAQTNPRPFARRPARCARRVRAGDNTAATFATCSCRRAPGSSSRCASRNAQKPRLPIGATPTASTPGATPHPDRNPD